MIGNIMVSGSTGKGRPPKQFVRIYALIILRVLGPTLWKGG